MTTTQAKAALVMPSPNRKQTKVINAKPTPPNANCAAAVFHRSVQSLFISIAKFPAPALGITSRTCTYF
jgi:hypothetical protein